ncbi:unnamed protein product [Prorocentrum cordatum]|uniref:Uncharacterized protein n=1 Tax=Prorocentrum cordatum TaxID=2364126 RepID=A0ABN9WCG1_9DINO|nr:unnamed protein product [Polarella glacialis]
MGRAVLAGALAGLAGRAAVGLQADQPDQPDAADWVSSEEFRTWGDTLNFDELEYTAKTDAAKTEKELKSQLKASELFDRNAVEANTHRAEMETNAGSELEGFAEPLNETEVSEMVDAWESVPGSDVTFSYGTHCGASGCRSSGHKRGQPSFQEMHRNVLASIRAMRFCFSDVMIVLDAPHTGHDKMGPETPGNVTSHAVVPHSVTGGEMVLLGGRRITKFGVDLALKSAAVATARAAAELLRDHCPTAAPQWRVKVIDYSSPEMLKEALEHYAIPEAERNTSFYERMYVNTMALDQNFQCKGQYVYHMDAQWRIYRSNHSHSAPNFISKALSLMKSDERVYMASVINTFNLDPQKNPYNRFAVIPGAVHGSTPVDRVKGMLQGWSPEQWLSQKRPLRGEAFHGNWENKTDEMNKRIQLYQMNWDTWGGIVTRHQFLMDVSRMKGLFPMEEWDTAAEHMWSANMNKKFKEKAFQIYFNETVGVFAGPSDA